MILRYFSAILLTVVLFPVFSVASAQEGWSLVVPVALQADEAVTVALDDLVVAATDLDIPVSVAGDGAVPDTGIILVGTAAENVQTAQLAEKGVRLMAPPENPEGFRIQPMVSDGRPCLVLTSRGPLGYAYGLFWIRDRMLVHHRIPESLEANRSPAFPVRLGGAWGRHGFGGESREAMRVALRNSINWVPGTPVLDLVPWDAEPEATRNAENREKTRALIDYAHSLHMKYFSFANEFTYHPSLLAAHGATLSVSDPKFWDALQEKYRQLFAALPELDGIELCNDDLSGFWENYRAYDLLHEGADDCWPYTRRFRTFVQKVHEVVVGEFGKQYFHFTWSLSDHEQHTQAAVFREIFTDAVPTKNLYLMPKVTRADRWWHQNYNPTFNLSPHHTIVLFEAMNYYEGGGTPLFPTFSGDYFQRGLQTFLLPEDSNVRGIAMLASIPGAGWGTRDAYAYVLYRLLWEPDVAMEEVARDFCAIHFGPGVADEMATIYRESAHAYKYGLHIEPISYGQYNSFYHMRVGVFPAEGYPRIDGGRAHLEWLRRIYLRVKPWETETLDDIQHGRTVAEAMYTRFQGIAPEVSEPALASDLQNRLDMTRHLIETNQRYVESMLAYFDYRERPIEARKRRLAAVLDDTRETCARFSALPGFQYKLWGVELLTEAMNAALTDLEVHKATLAAAPRPADVEQLVAVQQERFRALLQTEDAVKFARVRVQVDGRDILHVRGEDYRIEHLRWDHPHVQEFTSLVALPAREVTVLVRDIESRPLHPFILEQPRVANDYTASIYLDDRPGGQGWMEFELYYLDAPPASLGLESPWPDRAGAYSTP